MGTVIVGGIFLTILTWATIQARKDMKKGKCAGCSGCSDNKRRSTKENICNIKF